MGVKETARLYAAGTRGGQPLERAGSSVKVILLIRVVSLLPLTAFVALLNESTGSFSRAVPYLTERSGLRLVLGSAKRCFGTRA